MVGWAEEGMSSSFTHCEYRGSMVAGESEPRVGPAVPYEIERDPSVKSVVIPIPEGERY